MYPLRQRQVLTNEDYVEREGVWAMSGSVYYGRLHTSEKKIVLERSETEKHKVQVCRKRLQGDLSSGEKGHGLRTLSSLE